MVAKEMIRDRRILTLEGGQMTTLAIRAQEQAIERRTTQLAQPAGHDVGQTIREHATREVAERISAPLSPEQQHALQVLAGPERVAVLVGQLPSISPGGMFDRLASHAPTAELQTIHRTKDPAEQHAWRALRNGEPDRALAHYALTRSTPRR